MHENVTHRPPGPEKPDKRRGHAALYSAMALIASNEDLEEAGLPTRPEIPEMPSEEDLIKLPEAERQAVLEKAMSAIELAKARDAEIKEEIKRAIHGDFGLT